MHHCGNFIPRALTRREMLARCANGFGAIALTALMADRAFGEIVRTESRNPLAPRKPHFSPKAKSVIFLYMDGGPRSTRSRGSPRKMASRSG